MRESRSQRAPESISNASLSLLSIAAATGGGRRHGHLHERLQRANALACTGDRAYGPLRVASIERPALEHETRDGGVAEERDMRDAQLGKLLEPGRLENRVVVLDGEERYHHRHLPLLS